MGIDQGSTPVLKKESEDGKRVTVRSRGHSTTLRSQSLPVGLRVLSGFSKALANALDGDKHWDLDMTHTILLARAALTAMRARIPRSNRWSVGSGS